MDHIKDLSSDKSVSKPSDRSMQDMVVETLELMRTQQKALSGFINRSAAIAGEGPQEWDSLVAGFLAIIRAQVELAIKSGNIDALAGQQLRQTLDAFENSARKRMGSVQYDEFRHAVERMLKIREDSTSLPPATA
jgi:hypothetical protein